MTGREDDPHGSEPPKPRPAAELLRQARTLSLQQHFDAALAVVDAALILEPDSVAAATLRRQIELAREAAVPDAGSAQAGAQRFVPAGTDATRWQGYEDRILERRFRSLLETVQAAIDRRDTDKARQVFAEASRLRPAAPELQALDRRLRDLAGLTIINSDDDALLAFASEEDRSEPTPSPRLTPPDRAVPGGHIASSPVNGPGATRAPGEVPLRSPRRRLLPLVAVALVLAIAIGLTLLTMITGTRSAPRKSVTQQTVPQRTGPRQAPQQQTAPQRPLPSSDPSGSTPAADGTRPPPAVAAPGMTRSNSPRSTNAPPRSSDATRDRSTPVPAEPGPQSSPAPSPPLPFNQPQNAERSPIVPEVSVPAVPPPPNPAAPANAGATIPRTVGEDNTADRAAIQSVLNSYRTSYSRLDAPAVTTIWPSLDVNGLERAFASLKSQEMAFDRCTVEIREQRAEATCAGRLRYVPRIGTSSERTERLTWEFELSRRQRDWTIERVTAR